MNRNVSRPHVLLQPVEDCQAGLVRETDIEDDRAWRMFFGEAECLIRRAGDQGSEAHLAGEIAQDRGECLVVLDDQENTPLSGKRVAVILKLASNPWVDGGRRCIGGDRRHSHLHRWCFTRCDLRRIVGFRDSESERTALPRLAREIDGASEQSREFS